MTENALPAANESTFDSASDAAARVQPVWRSRRGLLEAMTVGGPIALAGCNLLQSSPEKDTDGESPTSGQTLRAPTGDDPAKTTFYGPWFNIPAYSSRALHDASYNLQRVIWEPGVRAEGFGSGATHYGWIKDPVKITPTEIEITIRENAKWSDGHQITGTDIALFPLQELIANHNPPYFTEEGPDDPANLITAIDGFDILDKKATYTSSAGHFSSFWEHSIINKLGTYVGPRVIPTHLEPYATYTDAVIDIATRALAGEIIPWKGYGDPFTGPDSPHKKSLVKNHLDKLEFVDKYSKPENVVATGAWDLVALDGKEFIFEVNTYHRNADRINFDTLRLVYMPSSKRERAALKSNRLDFSATRGRPTPQSVVEVFPDSIKQLLVPGIQFSGTELAINFDHPAMGDRMVRQAIMYALDHKTIANNIHPVANPPIETPGGDCWNATDFVSQQWIDENLTTYSTDREQAINLMREAGYTKDSGQWIGADGEPLRLTLTTTSDTPDWEPSVASQLNQFGIQTSLQTLSGTAFSNRVDQGAFHMWPSVLKSTTNLATQTLRIWRFAAMNQERFGIYPDEQFETGYFSRSGIPRPMTEERYRAFSIEAPQIGESNGQLKEYHPAALALLFQTNPPEAEFRRRIKVGMWLANWFLPVIPLTKKREQFFIDEAHWLWPTDTPMWEGFTGGESILWGSVFAEGTVQANPDYPEQGATVGNG